jgi:tRNA-specific 2-thiouridylase
MLARLDPRFLGRLWFPLGAQGKAETRAEAAGAGLEVASRAESQEACFLAGGDYRDFLERHGLVSSDGPIVDQDGNELGRHEGFWRFTPGQRKGLGVAAGRPLYAVRSEPRTNTVVVGSRAALATREVRARGRLHLPVTRAEVKLRYRSPAIGTEVESTDNGFRLLLDEPAYGVAGGQAAVLYADGAVVGAGTILTDPAETFTRTRALETEVE